MSLLPTLFLALVASLHGGQPPAELAYSRTLDRIELSLAGRLVQGSPGYDLADRRVWVTYAAISSGRRPRAEDARTIEARTAFWPTAVAILDEEHLAVGGRFAEPAEPLTVVEVWRLGRPRLEIEDGATPGRDTARLTGLGVLERTRIYESAAERRDMVRTLVRLRGRPGTLLAQFHDSGDVVELEYGAMRSTGPFQAQPGRLVLAAEPRPGALFIPALVNRTLVEVSVEEGVGRGITYALRPSAALRLARAGSGPEDRSLLLIDTEGNGTIDAWRTAGATAPPIAQRRPGP